MANYFAVYKGQEKGLAKLALAFHDHPAVERAYQVLKEAWTEVSPAAVALFCCMLHALMHSYC